jgi:superfamily II DNA or RNA helicase
MDNVEIEFLNHVWCRINCERSIAQELYDYFSYKVPGYRYNPKYQAGYWDGTIRLFKLKGQTIYTGLVQKVLHFCDERKYNVTFKGFEDPGYQTPSSYQKLLPEKFQLRDYQIDTIDHCVKSGRALFVSPTASGKSLIMYTILKHLDRKALIIVPNTTLVHQMASDFVDYGYDQPIHKIFSGQEKDTPANIVVSTWQSVYQLPAAWFDQFEIIIGDECHHCKAKSLVELLEKTLRCKYRFGFTGSLDGSKTHRLVLEGLFGPYKKIVSTKDLIDQGYIAQLKIKTIVLKYQEEERKLLKKATYDQELGWLVENTKRNEFVVDLALTLKGNTLILYRYVEKQGIPLFDILKEKAGNLPCFLVHGSVSADERNQIRQIVNTNEQSVTVASTGTFSEGVNIPNVNSIILASPSKSRILIMQMIGRGLRKSADKTTCAVYDIADDLVWKKYENHTWKHFQERLKYYIEEDFDFKQFSTRL